ncbi:MAG: hypothetical protein JWO46_2555 [Nocardioidaceae bacterium]|nr:hypothetical protein [Nocardioidaceae bacterium]
MKRFVSVLAGVSGTLLLAACGQQAASPPRAAPVGTCSPDSAKVTGADEVASVDLDGDGTAEKVSLTSADATGCASYLVARVGGNLQGAPLGDAASDGDTTWTAVSIPGRTGQVLVVRSTHPRGGYQDTMYGAAGGTFGPVVDASGKPLALPFVATDTPGGYVGVTCVDGGFAVREAVAHDPIGVVPAYDVKEIVYTISGLTAKADPATEVADNVLTNQLPVKYPELVKGETFTTGCSS